MSTKEQIIQHATERSQSQNDWFYTLPLVEKDTPELGKYGVIEQRACNCGDAVSSEAGVLVYHEWLQKHGSVLIWVAG